MYHFTAAGYSQGAPASIHMPELSPLCMLHEPHTLVSQQVPVLVFSLVMELVLVRAVRLLLKSRSTGAGDPLGSGECCG